MQVYFYLHASQTLILNCHLLRCFQHEHPVFWSFFVNSCRWTKISGAAVLKQARCFWRNPRWRIEPCGGHCTAKTTHINTNFPWSRKIDGCDSTIDRVWCGGIIFSPGINSCIECSPSANEQWMRPVWSHAVPGYRLHKIVKYFHAPAARIL